jgi:hypothetical protein
MALGLALFVHLHRRAVERAALLSELQTLGAWSSLDEPTALGLMLLGHVSPRDRRWLYDRLGQVWFETPTVFRCGRVGDDHVPAVVALMSRLGTVREVHFDGKQLTESGVAALRSGLPEVNVVLNTESTLHWYYHSKVDHEQFAGEALLLEASLVLGAMSLVGIVIWRLASRKRRGSFRQDRSIQTPPAGDRS